MVTRNGIYYNLEDSTYKFKTEKDVTFIFSSELYMNKFKRDFIAHREKFNMKMIARYRINVDLSLFADLILYKKLETRGFLITNDEGVALCEENLLLTGQKVMMKN